MYAFQSLHCPVVIYFTRSQILWSQSFTLCQRSFLDTSYHCLVIIHSAKSQTLWSQPWKFMILNFFCWICLILFLKIVYFTEFLNWFSWWDKHTPKWSKLFRLAWHLICILLFLSLFIQCEVFFFSPTLQHLLMVRVWFVHYFGNNIHSMWVHFLSKKGRVGSMHSIK